MTEKTRLTLAQITERYTPDGLPSLQAILRAGYLLELARRITKAGQLGLLAKSSFTPQVKTISGPRAAAVLVNAGQHTGEALQALTKNKFALARQFVPFEYSDHTFDVSLHQWYIRIEASWPIDLQRSVIPLKSVCKHPLGNGHWVVGLNETGTTVIGSLDDSTPHWLIAGQTGSGKTVAIHNLVYQLARAHDSLLILIDGKQGESLAPLAKLPCVLGPVATDLESARGALSFAAECMDRWYERHSGGGVVAGLTQRLVIVFDEFQEFLSDKAAAELVRKIASQGRAAQVHLVLATQHPVNAVMGDPQTKRNLTGRLVLQVTDFDASRVAIGAETPRADRLTGAGDCYCQGERVQGTLVDLADFEPLFTSDYAPSIDPGFVPPDWYDLDPGSLDILTREPQYTEAEIANALLAACAEQGRDKLRQRFANPPGGPRAARLVTFGRKVLELMRESGEVTI